MFLHMSFLLDIDSDTWYCWFQGGTSMDHNSSGGCSYLDLGYFEAKSTLKILCGVFFCSFPWCRSMHCPAGGSTVTRVYRWEHAWSWRVFEAGGACQVTSQ